MKGAESMPHPLITQLRFTRSEFKRGLLGLSDADARRRILPMNCISWNIGHMAWQEQRYWLTRLQGLIPLPQLNELVGYGQQTDYMAGTLLQRVIYHYWYHTGENAAIRQLLGHTDLPEFVGNIDDEAPYQPEAAR